MAAPVMVMTQSPQPVMMMQQQPQMVIQQQQPMMVGAPMAAVGQGGGPPRPTIFKQCECEVSTNCICAMFCPCLEMCSVNGMVPNSGVECYPWIYLLGLILNSTGLGWIVCLYALVSWANGLGRELDLDAPPSCLCFCCCSPCAISAVKRTVVDLAKNNQIKSPNKQYRM